MNELSVDDIKRISDLRKIIIKKNSLRLWYSEIYQKYQNCLKRSPKEGMALELGSGGSFAKKLIPELITSDILPYEGLDYIVNGTQMPFKPKSLRFVAMMNVLHHVSDPKALFKELDRCLVPSGCVYITDQYPGLFCYPILKYFHNEPFDMKTRNWEFKSTGPLSGANGALAWIIFIRDRKLFEESFTKLKIRKIELHSPLGYWLTGGLKNWNLLPKFMFKFVSKLDSGLVKINSHFASFMDIELEKES